jgi:arylsulfatase A-like enzyme
MRRPGSWTILALAVAAILIHHRVSPTSTGELRAKNVVLIVADTLRADHLGCYGATRPTSPAIDALANEAFVFDRAYASAPWTQPSIATMLTGLLSDGHGMKQIARLPDEVDTLAEVLSSRGFQTGAVVSHVLLARRYGFDQGFDRYVAVAGLRSQMISSSDRVTDVASRLARKMVQSGRPYFLFVHYFDSHYNYLAHPEWGFADESAGRLVGGDDIEVLRRLEDDLTADELEFIQDLYDEEIRHTDAAIEELLRSLRILDTLDETLVVFTADHGEEFLDHGALGHAHSLYEELVRVPLIIRPPGGLSEPRRFGEPVSLLDIAPTVLGFLSEDPMSDRAASMEGRSLLRLLHSSTGAMGEPVFLETDFVPIGSDTTARSAHKSGVIVGQYKLIRDTVSGAVELYDVIEDPEEQRNIAIESPEVVARLTAHFDERTETRKTSRVARPETVPQSPEQLEQLRALGYAEP